MPPATRSNPSCCMALPAAVLRAVVSELVAEKVPCQGANSSEEATGALADVPPTTSTLLLCGRRKARWPWRGVAREAAAVVKVPVVGSKISAEARSVGVVLPSGLVTMVLPPATRTRPSRRVVAEWPKRGVARLGPGTRLPATGSKMSMEATGAVSLVPPMISTRPSASTAVACCARGEESVPAKPKLRANGSKISVVELTTPALSPPVMKTR